jgi:hypothetical protein
MAPATALSTRPDARLESSAAGLSPMRIATDPGFRVGLAPGYRPDEPLAQDEWPDTAR